MNQLRESYGGTSGAEGGFGALPLGLLAEMRTRRASGVVCRRGSLAVGHSQPDVPRWTDACEKLASGLMPLAN